MKNLRLKSLDLNGFKTFASRTLFEFAAPVTAIVGPNGSGKSNIADALRWVLGEQSYGLLRGRKTEDMIFSGSEKRPQAGMASVSITFDNSHGWLPIDFSEVLLTRRAYRDGQNEYLINQQKVRLKDVSELLAQSGLSERTYTIIGQGLVDTALTLKSDERRRLFEEAAGIGLYRARKEQSLRRLDLTKRNLERAEDILAELKPRLRSLEKQAERAEEFSRLRADLRATLRQWYGFHWNRAQAELGQLRHEADTREANLGSARQKQLELSQKLNDLRYRTQGLRVQLGEWQRRLAELNSGREGASRGLAVADERQRALAERRTGLEEEGQRVEGELANLRTRLQEAESDAANYQTELSESQEQLKAAQDVLSQRQARQLEKADANRVLRERILTIQGQLSQSAAKREMLAARIERSQAEAAELERTLQGINQDIAAGESESRRLSDFQYQAEDVLAEKEKGLQDADGQLSKAIEDQKNAEATQNQLGALVTRLRAEMEGLEQAELAAASFAEGAKFLLQAAKIGKGTLGGELRVSLEYETAISAVLGTYLDAVLITERDPEAALRELESKDASAALLPIQALSLDGRVQARPGDGLVGLAADLVEVSADLRPAVELLLGHVLVAQDRRFALRILSENPTASQVVTLRGEVFHRGGQIEVRSPKNTGLSRPRNERDLRGQLERAVTDLARAGDAMIEKEAMVGQSDAAKQSAAKARAEAQLQLDEALRAIQSHKLDLEQLGKQQDWFSAQQRTMEKGNQDDEGEIANGAEREKQLTADLAKADAELGAHSHTAIDLQMDEQHAQVAHWEMRVAVSQRALQEAQRRTTERLQALQRAETQLVAQRERLNELEEQVQLIEQEKIQFGQQEGTVGEEIAAVEIKIAPAESELAKSDEQLNSLQTGESQALQNLSSAERAHTQAQISFARQQESLETLRTRIEDDFGLVDFQYDPAVSGPTPLPFGELVERLPMVNELSPEVEETLKEQRSQIRRLGSVNPEAQQEFASVKERVQSMQEQVTDLHAAEEDLKQIIAELDVLMDKEFRTTFDKVAAEFREIFSRLFAGGSAKLLLTEEQDMTTTGIDIEARLPGKRSQRLALLSGGERSLTAAALVFSLLKAAPTPFCVMDEVDAMLDEANVGRFTDLLRELSQETQFVVITHNRNTVQVADVIYGVTMGRDTSSQVISLKLDEVDERYSS